MIQALLLFPYTLQPDMCIESFLFSFTFWLSWVLLEVMEAVVCDGGPKHRRQRQIVGKDILMKK